MSQSTTEALQDTLTGQDEPMGKKHPWATAAIVFLIYPATIIAIIAVVLTFITIVNS